VGGRESHTVNGDPAARSTRRSRVPLTKAIDLLSGDQKGDMLRPQ
jgi:hypothetical protein